MLQLKSIATRGGTACSSRTEEDTEAHTAREQAKRYFKQAYYGDVNGGSDTDVNAALDKEYDYYKELLTGSSDGAVDVKTNLDLISSDEQSGTLTLTTPNTIEITTQYPRSCVKV